MSPQQLTMRRPSKSLLTEMETYIDEEFDGFLTGSTSFLSDEKTIKDIQKNQQKFAETLDPLSALVEVFAYNLDQDVVFPNNNTHWFLAGDMETLTDRLQCGQDWLWYFLVITCQRNDFLFSANWMLMQSVKQPDILGYSKTAKSWTKWKKDLYYSMTYTNGERYAVKDRKQYIDDMTLQHIPILESMTRPTR